MKYEKMESLKKFEVKFIERINKHRSNVITLINLERWKKSCYNDGGTLMRYQIILKAFTADYKLIVSEMTIGKIREINILYLSHDNMQMCVNIRTVR